MPILTEVQQQTFDYIQTYIAEKGYPPTRSEIAKSLGVAVNTVQLRLNALFQRGLIQLDPGVMRGIRILKTA